MEGLQRTETTEIAIKKPKLTFTGQNMRCKIPLTKILGGP